FAGFYLLSDVLGKLFNRTAIEVDERQIRIRTSPITLPWMREKTIAVSEVRQLFVTKTAGQRKPGVRHFTLSALLKNGKKVPLIKGLDRSTLQFVEAEMERYMSIKNTSVGSSG
ncbi:MAG: hypothetical protein OEQ53_19315, partial [Saprospiraceae bacterium]|nr:hypothetical protein [Saprospiraceae bacterium]